jgi:hypothetical protein
VVLCERLARIACRVNEHAACRRRFVAAIPDQKASQIECVRRTGITAPEPPNDPRFSSVSLAVGGGKAGAAGSEYTLSPARFSVLFCIAITAVETSGMAWGMMFDVPLPVIHIEQQWGIFTAGEFEGPCVQ